MKEIVVLSGKGGTGKTSIVGSLAALAERKVLADCDVDAADLHLLLSPSLKQENEFWSGQVAYIDPDKCTECVGTGKGKPQCASVCPVEAAKPDASRKETKEQLLEKWRKLHPGETPKA